MRFVKERIGKLLKELEGYTLRGEIRLTHYRWKKTAERGLEMADTFGWEEFDTEVTPWKGFREKVWFATDITLPAELEGEEVFFCISTGAEGSWDAVNPQIYFYLDGKLVQGLDVNHREALISHCAKAGETHHLALYTYTSDNQSFLSLDTMLAARDKVVKDFYYDLKVPYDTAMLLEEDDDDRIMILRSLNEAVNLLDLRQPRSAAFYESIEAAGRYLKEEFYGKLCHQGGPLVRCVGHSHIDVAWLWTLDITREKTARTFSTMLALMDQYPEFRFMASTPQVYKFIQEDEPELYEQVKAAIREGRWEPEGGMFLEADCNLTSGESLVRQFLYGKEFFQKEFGLDNKVLWLPDVFGYSAALPQIMKGCGIDYFMTTKISWNEYNKFPYDTFRWRGIDGTEVLTHFSPAADYHRVMNTYFTTYNGIICPKQIKGAWHRYQQKELNNEVLFAFGYGDGGGGPTAEMLENARRLEKGIPGCPRIEMTSVREFFEQLDQDTKDSPYLPWWSGELYFEYHRGTYTSMARNKRYNRKCEFLLEGAEKLDTIRRVSLGKPSQQSEIAAGWEVLMRNQFHDILPGSSIKEVYEDSKVEYEKLQGDISSIAERTMGEIAAQVRLENDAVLVFNTSGTVLSEVVSFPLPEGVTAVRDGEKLCSVQAVGEGKGIFFAADIPANGYRSFPMVRGEGEPHSSLQVSASEVQTPFYHVTFDEHMEISSLFDRREGREVLKKGQCGNALIAYEDKPFKYDAWDINVYYQENHWPVNDVTMAKVVENGPVRACIEVERHFLSSVVTQKIYFYQDFARIDFSTEIDWKEKDILLKAAFPVDVHAEEATYEIQYGNVTRPAHYNTSWDQARFEVCAHKWADLSEDGYGVSLLNDCKFGHDIHDGVMKLTLLKSATYPNPDADKEHHVMTYSLYPHAGSWREAKTVQQAYGLNVPPVAVVQKAQQGVLPQRYTLACPDCENVVVEAIKEAQDKEGVILRLYECYNRRTSVTLTLPGTPKAAWRCNMLEEKEQELQLSGELLKLQLRPYEIATIRIAYAE